MKMKTPALDRFAKKVKEHFEQFCVDPRFPDGSPRQLSLVEDLDLNLEREIERWRHGSWELTRLIRGLFLILSIPEESAEARESQLQKLSAWLEIDAEKVTRSLALVRELEGKLMDETRVVLDSYPEKRLGALLIELHRIDEETFKLDSDGDEFDYNNECGLPDPDRALAPQDYLDDLIIDAAVARLVLRHGRELLAALLQGIHQQKALQDSSQPTDSKEEPNA